MLLENNRLIKMNSYDLLYILRSISTVLPPLTLPLYMLLTAELITIKRTKTKSATYSTKPLSILPLSALHPVSGSHYKVNNTSYLISKSFYVHIKICNL